MRDDLSAQIAFHALDHPDWFDAIGVVSNNHFDQDGLAGVYALTNPGAARDRRDQVIDVARTGDFGTFLDRDAARISMAIAAYEDRQISPLDAAALAGPYPQVAAALSRELLPRFTDLLDHPEHARAMWEREDAHLGESIDGIESGRVEIREHPELDLAVVSVPEDWSAQVTHRFTQQWAEVVHPMAVNNATRCLRILLVQGHRYRLELRYESWVMLVSRPVLARPELRPLAAALTTLEPGNAAWQADPPAALTPRLHIGGNVESGLPATEAIATIERFLATAPAAWDPFAPREERSSARP